MLRVHEGLLDGIEGIAAIASTIESVLDGYVVNVDGVGTYSKALSNDDEAVVRDGIERITKSVKRLNEYWLTID